MNDVVPAGGVRPWFSRQPHAAVALVLLLAAAVLAGAAALRGFEYDEAYSIFVTSAAPRPAWPVIPFSAGSVRSAYQADASLSAVARALRQTDVHPPLYFWALALWRRAVGSSLFAARMLSVLFGLGALAAIAGIARLVRIPAAPAMLLSLGCYGFAYTSAVARGFALAQLLTLCGVLLALIAARRGVAWIALAAGVLLGAASFANYLASFVAAAVLLWLLLVRPAAWRCWLAGAGGFVLFLPGDLWFFLAQRGTRTGQFPLFEWLPGLARLARCAAGAVLGGLPLYVPSALQPAVAATLALVLAALVAIVAWRWRGIGWPGSRLLLGLCAGAPPVGLILLGLVFDTTPIELRYLAFATPFVGLLVAGALDSLPGRLGWSLGGGLTGLQALALAGLLMRPETMQPARATAAAAATLAGPLALVVLPRGNDGVGVPGPFVAEAPDGMRVLLVGRDASLDRIAALAAGFPRVVLAQEGPDADSRAVLPLMRAAFAGPCWHPAGVGFNVVAFQRSCEGD